VQGQLRRDALFSVEHLLRGTAVADVDLQLIGALAHKIDIPETDLETFGPLRCKDQSRSFGPFQLAAPTGQVTIPNFWKNGHSFPTGDIVEQTYLPLEVMKLGKLFA
jgi:hypothetical protein